MKRARILIVDDEQIARENLAYVLNKEGFEAHCVDSATRAFALLKSQAFDLVMTDLRLEGVGGMELLDFCKKRHPGTEVIVITGFATVAKEGLRSRETTQAKMS